MDDLYLEHYGVKGMHWGIRKARRYAKKASRYQKKADKAEEKGNEASRVKNTAYKKAYKNASKALDSASEQGKATSYVMNVGAKKYISEQKQYGRDAARNVKSKQVLKTFKDEKTISDVDAFSEGQKLINNSKAIKMKTVKSDKRFKKESKAILENKEFNETMYDHIQNVALGSAFATIVGQTAGSAALNTGLNSAYMVTTPAKTYFYPRNPTYYYPRS